MAIQKKIEIIRTNFPRIERSVPEVFILESLNRDDEVERRYEGRLLSEMLILAGKKPKYFYFQSKQELPHLMALFRLSRYRYLHFSAHADNSSVDTTEDSMTYEEFADFTKGCLKTRRLFMSACEAGNRQFVEAVAKKNKGIHSIIAPCSTIDFDHAAAIWSAFYVSIFTANNQAMKSKEIAQRFIALKNLFPVDFFLAFYDAKWDRWNFGA